VVQFDLSSRVSVLCEARDLGEPREASRPLRRHNRAFGSLPHQTAPLPTEARVWRWGNRVPIIVAVNALKTERYGVVTTGRMPCGRLGVRPAFPVRSHGLVEAGRGAALSV